ncbi:MAG TPA: DUF4381 domain-containing protein [Proteobacteria bacterium]|nr:DUF4381 domain-containing protein [Pseudomonadota bacterium]
MNPNNQNPLAALKDIHLPPVPGWFPPAPGWWILGFSLLALSGYAFYKWRQRQLFLRPITLALRELSQLELKSNDPDIQCRTLQEISTLLRRFCLVFFTHRQVAGLCGQSWLDFLKERAGEKDLKITDAELLPLLEEAYAPVAAVDLEALGNVVEKWLVAQKRKTRRRS